MGFKYKEGYDNISLQNEIVDKTAELFVSGGCHYMLKDYMFKYNYLTTLTDLEIPDDIDEGYKAIQNIDITDCHNYAIMYKAYCDKIEYLINFMGATGLIDDCVITLLTKLTDAVDKYSDNKTINKIIKAVGTGLKNIDPKLISTITDVAQSFKKPDSDTNKNSVPSVVAINPKTKN